jgi:hypothetical protein
MKLVYKSFTGIILIGVLFLFCNSFYEGNGWQDEVKRIDDKLLLETLKNSVRDQDILYFAESSNASYQPITDSIKKSISELINDCFPELRIKAIERGALHAGVFKNLIDVIPENSKTKTIIVTMNLRSFGSGWIHSNFENDCQQLKIIYNKLPPLYNKMRLVFKMYNYKEDWERTEDFKRDWKKKELHGPLPLVHKTVREWDTYIYDNPFLNEDGSRNDSKTELAAHNVKSFAFNIDTLMNPRIEDFDEIVTICKKKKIQLYFNLLPENIEYADSLVGKELTSIMKMNRDILVDYYTRKGVKVIDNLELVKGKDYLDQNWTTEHYDQTGRITIAKNVAEHLQQQFPEFYKDCNY